MIRAWRDFTASAPDELNSLMVLWSVPDDEHFPEELRRRPIVVVAAVYIGPVEEGERVMQPLRELATPLMDLSGPIPVHGAAGRLRPLLPQGPPLLLEIDLRRRPER